MKIAEVLRSPRPGARPTRAGVPRAGCVRACNHARASTAGPSHRSVAYRLLGAHAVNLRQDLVDDTIARIAAAKDADAGQPIVMKSGLHRTFFEDPTATLARAGAWRLQSQHSIEEWGTRLGVAVPTSPVGGGYWLTMHEL